MGAKFSGIKSVKICQNLSSYGTKLSNNTKFNVYYNISVLLHYIGYSIDEKNELALNVKKYVD